MRNLCRIIVAAGFAVLGSLADDVLTPDKVEADITTEA